MDKQTKDRLGLSEEKPTDWFENLYAGSNTSGEGVPWANMDTHPVFKDWLSKNAISGNGKKALVVGCGLGDDAIELENLGFNVTAFDVAESAIEICKKRFSNSTVDFVTADLLAGIPEWENQFDFVLEIFTIQALPPKYEELVIKNLSKLIAPYGELMVITEVQNAPRNFEVGPPWLLNHNYIELFEREGLKLKGEINQYPPAMGTECHLSIFQKD